MSEFASPTKRVLPYSRSFLLFLTLLLAWFALLLLFNRFPGIDLAVASYFFTDTACLGTAELNAHCGFFAYDSDVVLGSLRTITLALPYIAVLVLVAALAIYRARLKSHWRIPAADQCIAALLSLAIGCGLIVNVILKATSGRPRPRDTNLFGGNLDFVQAGSFAGKCLRNCSFISGEASSGGWLLCLILLLPPHLRLRVGLPLAIISLLMPFMRVVTGAHYLSDAVLGWLSSLVVFAGVLAFMEGLERSKQL